MASGDTVKELGEELACSICLKSFKEYVILSCGHNFCQSCLDQCWEGKEASCPQCREKVQEGGIKRNWQEANLVEVAKELGSQKVEEKVRVCQRHQEPLKLFCKDHEAPICVVCDGSQDHENHQVIPLEEASKDYKDQIWTLLESLKEEREKILTNKANTAKEVDNMLEKTQMGKEKTMAAFRRMHRFLEDQERNLLAKMKKVEKWIWAKREEHLARLSEELSSISSLMQEMEEKHQQPASELLQDIGSFLQRYQKREKCETPVVFPPALKWKIWDFHDITPFLEGVMKQCRGTLESGLQQQKAHVTLDPDTAYPQLILSKDRRHLIFGKKKQDLPDNPERFRDFAYALGQERFTGGRHFWEVHVGSKEGWSVGVARKSVERKDLDHLSPDAGIWEVGKWGSAYRFLLGNRVTPPLTLSKEPKRVRVSLNYEGGWVAFYDADSAALIFEYPPASFSGETLLPFFFVNKNGQLKLCR